MSLRMNTVATIAPHRWRILASAMVSFFAVGVTFFAVPPLIGPLRAAFALSNLQLGILMGAIAAPAILLSVPFGAALDRWPPRSAGLAGLAAMLAGSATFAVAPSYGWLLVGRLVFGAGALLMNLLLARMIAVAFAGREVALAMGLFTGTYAGSMIVLYSVHTFLEKAFGWRVEMVLLALLVLAAIPLHGAFMPRRIPHAQNTTVAASRRALTGPLVALGIAWMLYFVPFSAIATFGPEWSGKGGAGLLITSTITWVALFGTPLAGALIDRTGRPTAWCVAGLALLAGVLGLMAADMLAPVVAMAAIGVVASAVPPAFYSLPARLVPAERVGLAFGFITALSNLGTVAGPALAGAVCDATPSWPVVWGSLAGVAVAGAAAATLAWPGRCGNTPA